MNIDPEDNWEEGEQAEQIFRQNKISPGREKTFSQAAIENGVVIGATATGWSKSGEYGEDQVYVFSFDIVVKPEFRRQGVGMTLIRNAIAKYNTEKSDYMEMGYKTMMRLWVVNPILVPVLEQLGFETEAGPYEDGSMHLIAY